MLIKAIANNCPKIKILYTYLEPEDFIHIKLLLLNCRSLEFIWFDSLDSHVNGNDYIGDELLDILAKFSPNCLTEIYISFNQKYSIDALERFFESCRERTLYEFGFIYGDTYKHNITKDLKAVVDKYVKERVVINSYIQIFSFKRL